MAATIHAARNNTFHLLTVLVTAALVLAPQPPAILGAELVPLHLYGLRLPIVFTYRHFVEHHGGFQLRMTITIAIAYLLGAAGGAVLIRDPAWGLYLVSASCVLLLARTVLTAWNLMFGQRRLHKSAEAR